MARIDHRTARRAFRPIRAGAESGVEPIEAIATSLGFLDPERMRRAFVRRFGMSPQAMLRASRRHDTAAIAELAEQL